MQPDRPGADALDVGGVPAAAIPLWDGGARVGTHVLTRLSLSCLSFLSSHPGASGSQICRGLGVRHLSQISRLMGRLEARGLVANDRTRRENAWTLTRLGYRVLNDAQPVWAEHAVGGDGAPQVSASLTPVRRGIHSIPSITA